MSGGFIFPLGPPDPELTKKLQEEHERRHMEAEANSQELFQFLTELEPDKLSILRGMFARIINEGNEAPILAANYEGICVAILVAKHDRCPGCGEDHTKDFLEHLDINEPEIKDDE